MSNIHKVLSLVPGVGRKDGRINGGTANTKDRKAFCTALAAAGDGVTGQVN